MENQKESKQLDLLKEYNPLLDEHIQAFFERNQKQKGSNYVENLKVEKFIARCLEIKGRSSYLSLTLREILKIPKSRFCFHNTKTTFASFNYVEKVLKSCGFSFKD